MLCYSCGFKLHTGDETECQLCGAKFAIKCRRCGCPNLEFAAYCFHCGEKLTEDTVKNSVKNNNKLSENRKNVAVIFADVSGFTKLSENMDPEEVRDIINDCFTYITRPVYELEGTIDKFIGDCVMILFGAKYSHSDDAKRAVVCVLEMKELIKSFSEIYLSSRGINLNLSIGVNYGLVVTGKVGNYFDQDYTVMGDTVNTAQRLQVNSAEGVILVSESVYMDTRDVISYTDAKSISVKNRKEAVKCYVPVEVKSDYSFEAGFTFLERENEISVLNAIYGKTKRAGMQFVSVTGDAGVGKTRLVKEFLAAVDNSVKKIWVDCSNIFQNRSYHLLSTALMTIMNINARDNNNVKQHRLVSFLDYIMPDFPEEETKKVCDYIGMLMSLRRDNDFMTILNSMSIENIRREIIKQLVLFLNNLSKKSIYVLVVDDLHWADNTSLQILKEVLLTLQDTRIMFVFTSRADVANIIPGLEGKGKVLALGALSDKSTREMTCSLLNCEDLDEKLFATVKHFTGGNPLYIKELAAALIRTGKYKIENGIAFSDTDTILSLPENIQSLVLANISDIDDSSRNFLQIASVAGKYFSLTLVKSILGTDLADEELLRKPIMLNIIVLRSVNFFAGATEKEYAFNSDIEREAIYDSILNREKREYHQKIGEYIELNFSDVIENYYEILCLHFENAGMVAKTREYYYKTAQKRKNDFNLSGAQEYYKKYLETSPVGINTKEDVNLVQVLKNMGYIYHVMANYELAISYYNRALEETRLSDEMNTIELSKAEVYRDMGSYDESLEILNKLEGKISQENTLFGKLLQIKCNMLRIVGNSEALSLARKSEKILLKAKDYANLSETMKNAGIIYYSRGDVENALSFMNKAYKYAEKVNNLEGMAKISGDLGIICHSTGMITKALEYFNKSIELSKKISYPRGYIAACINLGVLYLDKGLFKKAEFLFRESLKMSEEIGSKLYECISLTNLGDIMYEKGSFKDTADFYNRSLTAAKKLNAQVEEGINILGIAKIKIAQKKYSGVEELLGSAEKIFTEADEVLYLCDCSILKSRYELAKGKADDALADAENAITLANECKSDKKGIVGLRMKGRILLASNRAQESLEIFEKASLLSMQIESDYEAAKSYYGKFLALESMGLHEDAKNEIMRAEECINRIDKCSWTDRIKLESEKVHGE